MPKISITTRAESSATPEEVLAAAYDFSERREKIWPNVSTKRLEVHSQGETFAEATEGSMGLGVWWERCRYDWSRPGVVTATVIDSNVYHPELSGFVWRARPREGGGSGVEMTIYRQFKMSPKGLAATMLYKLARSWWLGGMQRQVLRAIESESGEPVNARSRPDHRRPPASLSSARRPGRRN